MLIVGRIITDESEIEWPDDSRCGKCGSPVGDDGVKVHYVSIVVPREPDLYGWCGEHAPETVEEEPELWEQMK